MYSALIVYASLLLVLGLFVFFSLRKDGWRRYVAPIGYSIMCIAMLYGFVGSMGYAIPKWAYFRQKEFTVLTVYYDEPNAIYVWGYSGDDREPIVIKLPWTEDAAKQASEQQQKAAIDDTSLKLNLKQSDPIFYSEEGGEVPIEKQER